MSILRKEGKEKLRFKKMNNRVLNSDFKLWTKLCLQCLNENPDICVLLDQYYKQITVLFFYESTDKGVTDSLRESLADPSFEEVMGPIAGVTYSRKNFGGIAFFLNNYKETIRKRTDIVEISAYTKNGVFEEFCHLVEQEGDSSIHPSSYWKLWNRYRARNLLPLGNEIIAKLDTHRNHYEVYHWMLKAYPNDWVVRYSKFHRQKDEEYEQLYQSWKKVIPTNVVYARLVTDYFQILSFQFVLVKAKDETLTEENSKLLTETISIGIKALEHKKRLIERDMGSLALALIESLDEPVFNTPETYFSVVLDLWINLGLI
jgi:hypothetical protein